ncbi:MAG: peroxidase family protein [Mycobacterium sp.]
MKRTSASARLAERTDRLIGWWRLPKPLGLAVLIGLRTQLRSLNLHDSGRAPGDVLPGAGAAAAPLDVRTVDGSGNDIADPSMGAVGRRFGRNVPLASTYPEPDDALLEPNPREISNKLLARDEFQPAWSLNLLAAAWIQFEVHDWLSHATTDSDPFRIPTSPEDRWPNPMLIHRTEPDPTPSPTGPPTYVTDDTFWWDASQIYGVTKEFADAIRTKQGGRLQLDELGLPEQATDLLLDPKGNAGNSWVGLAVLHSLFMREHNAICGRLERNYPWLTDQQLYDIARLVNSALMTKIHTIEWTPAIIGHPTTIMGMRANWFGLLGERFARRFGRLSSSEALFGIPGSATDHHDVPYSLTEEFVAVYRMHPLMPDSIVFRAADDNRKLAEHELPQLTVENIRARLDEIPMVDVLYTLGRHHPGSLSLHNFPNHLRELRRADGTVDLAAIDVLRIRERGVPRYNEFRRQLRLKPAKDFEDITDNEKWAEELRQVYGHVERVDLMVGMFAERKPPGFGFSDTAFRIFILMAVRRIKSDRFLTRDYRPEVYTHAGMRWIRDNSMRSVLLRHFPELEDALRGVANPFAPWTATAGVPMR